MSNAWLITALHNAKDSMLPELLEQLGEQFEIDSSDLLAAVEVTLLAVAMDDVTEDKLRNGLRAVFEPYTDAVACDYISDAIIATLEWRR